MSNIIDLFDLRPVAQFAEGFILFVHKNDLGKENPMCVQLNLGMKRFDPVQPIGTYLKFNPFEPLDSKDNEVHLLYQRTIYDRLSLEEIFRLMREFSDKTGYVDE
jgi:hypothetical protein